MLSIDHDELFRVNSAPFQLQGRFQDSRPVITASRNVESTKPKYSRQRKSSVAFSDTYDEENQKDFNKRIAHRDVERQRRQEMASLYLSLRSLLPDQYLELQGRFQDSRPVITASRNVESTKPKYSRRRKSSVAFSDTYDGENQKDFNKRIAHRDVERQRRQEMASLYLSLRSLLPDRYLEGKRSTSDYVHATVEYIKYLNQRVEKLTKRKNELQEFLNLGSFKNTSESSYSQENSSIMINGSTSGMEVILSTTSIGGIPLSKFLNVLSREGLSMRSCNSIKVNERRLHIAEFEVDEGINVDPTKLLEKLQDL